MKGECENVRPVREFGQCLESSSNCHTVLFQFKMNRRLAGKQNKAGEAQARKAQQRLFKARSNAAGELFGKQPFQFTGLQSDMYYFCRMTDLVCSM